MHDINLYLEAELRNIDASRCRQVMVPFYKDKIGANPVVLHISSKGDDAVNEIEEYLLYDGVIKELMAEYRKLHIELSTKSDLDVYNHMIFHLDPLRNEMVKWKLKATKPFQIAYKWMPMYGERWPSVKQWQIDRPDINTKNRPFSDEEINWLVYHRPYEEDEVGYLAKEYEEEKKMREKERRKKKEEEEEESIYPIKLHALFCICYSTIRRVPVAYVEKPTYVCPEITDKNLRADLIAYAESRGYDTELLYEDDFAENIDNLVKKQATMISGSTNNPNNDDLFFILKKRCAKYVTIQRCIDTYNDLVKQRADYEAAVLASDREYTAAVNNLKRRFSDFMATLVCESPCDFYKTHPHSDEEEEEEKEEEEEELPKVKVTPPKTEPKPKPKFTQRNVNPPKTEPKPKPRNVKKTKPTNTVYGLYFIINAVSGISSMYDVGELTFEVIGENDVVYRLDGEYRVKFIMYVDKNSEMQVFNAKMIGHAIAQQMNGQSFVKPNDFDAIQIGIFDLTAGPLVDDLPVLGMQNDKLKLGQMHATAHEDKKNLANKNLLVIPDKDDSKLVPRVRLFVQKDPTNSVLNDIAKLKSRPFVGKEYDQTIKQILNSIKEEGNPVSGQPASKKRKVQSVKEWFTDENIINKESMTKYIHKIMDDPAYKTRIDRFKFEFKEVVFHQGGWWAANFYIHPPNSEEKQQIVIVPTRMKTTHSLDREPEKYGRYNLRAKLSRYSAFFLLYTLVDYFSDQNANMTKNTNADGWIDVEIKEEDMLARYEGAMTAMKDYLTSE